MFTWTLQSNLGTSKQIIKSPLRPSTIWNTKRFAKKRVTQSSFSAHAPMVYSTLLPCLQLVSDQDSRTVIGRTRHVTSAIWSRIDWLTGPKSVLLVLRFAELEMDKTVHLEFYLPLSGRSEHQFQ